MKKALVPGLLVTCTLLVAFWIVASQRHARPFKPFNLTYQDFAGYCPAVEGSVVQSVPMTTHDPAEPNIVTFSVQQGSSQAPSRLGVRLVHGYNMPMCMKIKGYTVEPLFGGVVELLGCQVVEGRKAGHSNHLTTQQPNNSTQKGLPGEVWRVTSSSGDASIWVTTMIRSEDFSVTSESVTSMAFPRVDIPDDPNWTPRGLNGDDLKHPLQSLRRWFRSRWNGSRTDVLTFLRLRQPAWASEELLTYVSRSLPPSVSRDREPEVIRQVIATHAAMLQELQTWRRTHRPGGE